MPLPHSGAPSALEPRPLGLPAAGDTAPLEESVPSRPALDVTSAGSAATAAAPNDTETTAPLDAGTSTPNDDETATPPTVASDCGALGGFSISSTSSCYFFSDTTFSWHTARTLCQAWGGDLVEIDSAEENEALAPLVIGSVWTGANDEAQEGTFRWAGGALLAYTAWAPNQPDDWEGAEDCGELMGLEQLWNDRPCTDYFAKQALCERVVGAQQQR